MKIKSFFIIALLLLVACNNKSNQQEKLSEMVEEATFKEIIVDLTHDFSDETIYWVNAKEFELDEVAKGQTDKGYFYSANNFATAEHGGTHIDAPIHFAEKGQSVDQIPLEKLIGSAIKVDVSSRALENRDYLISIEDFKEWEEKEGMEIPEGSIVLLETGYSKFYPDKVKYLGTEERGDDAIQYLHFPGLSSEAAEWLVENRKINAIGIDTPSIDYGQSEYFKSHVILMTQDIPAFENLTNLDKVPARDFQIIALPMKIKGGSGGPLRVVAVVKN